MKKGNLVLIVIIILLLLVIVSGIILYVFVLSKPNEGPKEITIDKNIVAFSLGEGGSSFINNVADSKKMSKVTIAMDVDKKVAPLLTYKEAEFKDRVNLLLRSMKEEDFNGPEGQKKIREHITEIAKEIVNTNKTIEVYIIEILVQ